ANDITDPQLKSEIGKKEKDSFKLFDFFANCEYFEEKFNYDEVLKLPLYSVYLQYEVKEPMAPYEYHSSHPDQITTIQHTVIGPDGMKIDRKYFERFETIVLQHPHIKEKAEAGQWDELLDYLEKHILNKPKDYFTLEKLRQSIKIDRRISMKEIIEKILGIIPYFKTKNQLLDEEFDKFDSRYLPKEEYFEYAKTVFKAYITDAEFRAIVDNKDFALLNVSPYGEAYKKLPPELRNAIPEYIKDFVPLNTFVA
ncbi:MAG: hypothetical protein N2662_09660, partial [Bacteroidales bacterium]|nr:hypothetical protein [Bacteroidales bacterium]